LRGLALEVGFDLAGLSHAEKLDPAYLEAWVEAGHHASLDWMASSVEVRCSPFKLLPSAKSVLSLGLNYFHPQTSARPGGGRISRYAWGRDYHKVIATKLKSLRLKINASFPEVEIFGGVDAVPIAEKVWAQRAGLGWIGKNGNLISQRFGSWLFLATLVTNLEVEADREHPNRCGRCNDCLPACPTDAIYEGSVIDSRRCLAFHTIEHKDPWPEAIADANTGWVFGCDACQEVCPWNHRFQINSSINDLAPRPMSRESSLATLLRMTESDFDLFSRGSPIRRAGRVGFLRSVTIATELEPADDVLDRALYALDDDPSPVLRHHATRALHRRASRLRG